MKTLLEKAKRVLVEGAINLYDIRKDDLDLELSDFENHFKNLGSMIFQIESYKTFGEIISDLENDNLSELGYWGADDDLIEEFLKAVEKIK
jgi:hypothetical protein